MPRDMSELDEGASPSPKLSANDAKLAKLPDGKYEFEVSGSSWDKIKDGLYKLTVNLNLICPDLPEWDGKTVNKEYWVNLNGGKTEEESRERAQRSIGFIMADFLTLGFDSDQWTPANGRPFSREITKAARHLIGIRFAGAKATKTGDQKGVAFRSIYINKRLPDDRPEKFGPEEINSDPPVNPHDLFRDDEIPD